MSDQDPDLTRVTQHVDALADHFDTVQIFVSRHEAGAKDGTVNVALGAGNWFARYGQTKEWIVRREEDSRCMARPNDNESKP